jgi:2'-5' RNA ligase
MRIFISVELPDEVKKNITELINELKLTEAGVRWVETKNLHITLKFLGWVDDKKLNDVIDLATRAAGGSGSFKAKFEGIGTFPPGKAPRVIWAGIVEGGDKLERIADALEKHFSGAGYRSEERGFSSHITIGRVKDNRGVDKLKEKMSGFERSNFGEMKVDQIAIMRSTLTPHGPVYEIIREVKL